jgi:hypothetical protein
MKIEAFSLASHTPGTHHVLGRTLMKDSGVLKFQLLSLRIYLALSAMIVVKHGMERHDTLTIAFGVSGFFALFTVGRWLSPPAPAPASWRAAPRWRWRR